MRKACLLSTALLLLVAPTYAATVITSANCGVASVSTEGATQCAASDEIGGSSGSAAGQISLGYSFSNTNSITFAGSTITNAEAVLPSPQDVFGSNSFASVSASLQVNVNVTGTGPGFVIESQVGGGIINLGTEDEADAGVAASDGASSMCDAGPPDFCLPAPLQTITVPIELGGLVTFDASLRAYAGAVPGFNNAAAQLSFVSQFSFVGADGVTPVAISEAPEPRTCGIMAVAVAFLLTIERRRLRRQRTSQRLSDSCRC